MITLKKVLKTHKDICGEARKIIEIKGHDYNREQQKTGDTLFNLRVAKLLGINKSTTQGILTRLSDKFMRLISLTKDPNVEAAVKDESVKDTIKDTINYLVYLYLFYQEMQVERRK